MLETEDFCGILPDMITPTQCRMARAALQWTVTDLSDAAKVSRNTITNFETGQSQPNRATISVIRSAFERAGLEFINGDAPGVRLHKQ